MKKVVLIVALALAAVVVGTLIYAKFFVTPLDKEGMVYIPPEEAGEDTAAPGLVNAELPAMCFFRDGTYRYSVPSPIEGAENLAIEFFFMLCIDREGSVTTELLGEKWLNRATGEASYLRGTEEIAQRDYDGADFFRYGGDDCCECTWEWVELLEGWNEADQRQALTDSWENFVFDTLGILNR